MPAVSVLIPVHNTARWLAETLHSVQHQTFSDWELIAIDDGSSDDSLATLTSLATHDPRIRVLGRQSKGLIATRNELLAMARGEFLAWLDSDDQMTPNRLPLQLEHFAKEPGLLCLGGGAMLTDPDGLPIRTHAFPTDHDSIVNIMKDDIGFYFGSTMMRRDAVLKAGGFREPFHIGEDFDLCLRLSERGRVGNTSEVILVYRQHMTSTCNSGRAKCAAYRSVVKQLASERRATGSDRLQRGEPVTVDFGALASEKDTVAETHRRWAWWALAEGYFQTARKYSLRALRDAPFNIESWRLLACTIRGR